MKKLHLIVIALFFLFCAGGWLGLLRKIDTRQFGTLERRLPAEAPNVPTVRMLGNRWDMQRYFNEWGAYLSDRILARSLYIKTYLNLGLTLTPAVQEGLCVQGKEGWLFQGNSGHSRNMIDYTKNMHSVNEEVVSAKVLELEQVFTEIRKHDAIPVFLVAPNKMTIYSEFLPDWLVVRDSYRFADRVYDLMKKRGEPLLFPKSELLKAKDKWQLYFKDDSHWNEAAAYIALKQAMEIFSSQGKKLRFMEQEDITLRSMSKEWLGDLIVTGNLDHRMKDGMYWYFDYPQRSQRKDLKKYEIEGYEAGSSKNAQALNKGKLLFLHDSFGGYCLNYLYDTFSDVVDFSYRVLQKRTLKEILEQEKPDYVLFVQVERYFWKY